MAKPVFAVYLDLLNDGSFTGGNVSAYLQSASVQIGFTEPFESMGRDNTASIELINTDRRFSPEYSSGAYYGQLTTGLAVKITVTYASVTTVLYLGWIASISPLFNSKGSRTATIECTGWMDRAQRAESLIPLQISQTADIVILEVLENASIYPPGFTGYWLLGTSTIGQTTRVGAVSTYFVAETGITNLAYAGDWEAGTTVYEAIENTVQREAGRLFVARNGVLYFYNRHHFLLDTAIDATFTDSMTDMSYSYGTEVSNQITATYQPRSVGTPGETLAVLGNATFVASNTALEISFRFTDVTGGTIAATAIITPVTVTDYTANALADGTGTDLTANITAIQVSSSATQITIEYTNAGPDAYILETAKVRGTPLTTFEEQTYTAEDADSILQYGKLAYSLSGTQDTLEDATTIADFHLALLKDPVGLVESVTFAGWNTSLTSSLIARTIGDKITVHETQTGINGNWFIIGETHEFSSEDYRITWVLEDAGASAYWTIGISGYSEIGQTTYAGPL